ncbi:MAG: KAP family P-loop NTPase fold protein [Myxococcota bacterium]
MPDDLLGAQDSAYDPSRVSEGGSSDPLKMSKYAKALARFVCHSHTPMTVGIQGEWGSGKTSLMNMMRAEIRGNAQTATHARVYSFETWQYGALEGDGALGVSLVSNITSKIARSFEEDDSRRWQLQSLAGEVIGMLGTVATRASGHMVEAATAGVIRGRDIEELATRVRPGSGHEDELGLDQIKSAFKELVANARGGSVDRFVIFIDDLDRIRPGNAVAMLEVMKNFMDVEGCVFVLACDYEVVRLGVRERFGIDDPAKARAFFDKIIQVPFQMPVRSYEIQKLLEEFLAAKCKRANKGRYNQPQQNSVENAARMLDQMVKLATGTNPRAFKRFLNVLDLLSLISEEYSGDSERRASVWLDPQSPDAISLVALVALQTRWPGVADHIASREGVDALRVTLETLRGRDDGSDDETAASEQVDEDLLEMLQQRYGGDGPESWESHEEVADLHAFGEQLFRLLDREYRGQRNYLDVEELEPVQRWARRVSLTGTRQTKLHKTPWLRFRESLVKHVTEGIEDSAEDKRVRQKAVLCCDVLDTIRDACESTPFRTLRKPDSFTVLLDRSGLPDERAKGTPKQPTLISASTRRLRIKLNLGPASMTKYQLPRIDEIGQRLARRCDVLGLEAEEGDFGWYVHFTGNGDLDRKAVKVAFRELAQDLVSYAETAMDVPLDSETGPRQSSDSTLVPTPPEVA